MTTTDVHQTENTDNSITKRNTHTATTNEHVDDLVVNYYFNRNDTVFVENNDKLSDDGFDDEKGCSDFICCNTQLPDLHSLLKHYEEEHVIVEVVEENNSFSDPPTPNPISPAFTKNSDLTRVVHMGYAPPDSTDSAFETSIFRAVTPVGSNYHGTTCNHPNYSPPRKRPKSMVSFSSYTDSTSTSKTDHFSNDPSLECALNMLQSFANASRDSNSSGGFSSGSMDQASWRLIQNALSNTLPLSLTSSSASLLSQNSTNSSGNKDDQDSGGSNYGEEERPFVCRIKGCLKTYKNANGLKYHMRHGHHEIVYDESSTTTTITTTRPCSSTSSTMGSNNNSTSASTFLSSKTSTSMTSSNTKPKQKSQDSSSDLLVEKPHRCPQANCGKRYKNANGLKYHILHGHSNPQTNAPNGTISFVPNQNNRMVLHGHHGISLEDSYLESSQRQTSTQPSQHLPRQTQTQPTINRQVNSNALEAIQQALNREKALRLQNK